MNQPLNSNVIISDMHINIFIYHIASGYSVQGPISVKHQLSCPAVIPVITISVNFFNNKLQDHLYRRVLQHLKQNPIQWLYDQRIQCLQGCLVELHWRSAVLSLS